MDIINIRHHLLHSNRARLAQALKLCTPVEFRLRNENGQDALMLACKYRPVVVPLLLMYDFDVNAIDNFGLTAVHYLLYQVDDPENTNGLHAKEALQLLLKRRPNLDVPDLGDRKTARDLMEEFGLLEMLQ